MGQAAPGRRSSVSNVKEVTHCPECGARGTVTEEFGGRMKKMACPKCGLVWTTMAVGKVGK